MCELVIRLAEGSYGKKIDYNIDIKPWKRNVLFGSNLLQGTLVEMSFPAATQTIPKDCAGYRDRDPDHVHVYQTTSKLRGLVKALPAPESPIQSVVCSAVSIWS